MFQRLSAFFDNVWAFILTLVRSLLALFSFRRGRASDPFTLPSVVHRAPNDALARAHSRLRPILLTPRSLAVPTRALNLRSRSATSTLADPQATDLQRTSPKLDPVDTELGLSAAHDLPALPPPSATSSREGTPDTSSLTSSYVSPLTPPDRCYLAPLPSIDCPYSDSWPNDVALAKPRFPGSPLKVSININSIGPIGSPPPGHWSPVQIWTSTPCKNDPDPAFSPFDPHKDPVPALSDVSNALISRSRSSIQPYDDPANASPSSDASIFVDYPNTGTLQRHRDRHRAHARVPRLKTQPYPKFHHPDAYAYAWPRHSARLPGKANRSHAYTRSHSHMDVLASQWYDADAYASSPVSALSPPQCESATEDETEDEDEMPLGRLRERLARRNAVVGAGLGLSVTISPKATAMSPRTRRMSEGCLLAITESTPTRVGVGSRSGDGHGSKDWLEALSLRFPSEHKDALAPNMVVSSVDAVVA